jgi:hypothetical protein
MSDGDDGINFRSIALIAIKPKQISCLEIKSFQVVRLVSSCHFLWNRFLEMQIKLVRTSREQAGLYCSNIDINY